MAYMNQNIWFKWACLGERGRAVCGTANVSAASHTAQSGVFHAARMSCPCVCCSGFFFPWDF